MKTMNTFKDCTNEVSGWAYVKKSDEEPHLHSTDWILIGVKTYRSYVSFHEVNSCLVQSGYCGLVKSLNQTDNTGFLTRLWDSDHSGLSLCLTASLVSISLRAFPAGNFLFNTHYATMSLACPEGSRKEGPVMLIE